MNTYTGKKVDLILNDIATKQGVAVSDIEYTIIKQSGFSVFSKVEISAYTYLDCISSIKVYLADILNEIGFKDVEVAVKFTNNNYLVDITTDNNGLLIGLNGKNIYSLETLVNNVLTTKYKKRFYIKLDANSYFKDKEIKLYRLAKKLAAEVGKTKIDVKLDAMPNYDRKVIHKALKDVHYVKTKSFGAGKNRHLVIMYDKENDLKYNEKKIS